MALGRKTGGRQKGSRNRATTEARAAAEAIGILPLDYMLSVMRDALFGGGSPKTASYPLTISFSRFHG